MRPARVLVVTALTAASLAAVTPPAAAEPVLVSELGFAADDPTFDPHGTGTRLWGDVAVAAQGYLDFRGRSVVETPDRAALNPGNADFSFGARIALTRGVGDWNIMQKGSYADRQWKLSTHQRSGRAQLSCRIKGSAGVVHVYTAGAVLDPDGSWHQVGCARVGNQVQVRLDGAVVATGTGPIGSVSSARTYLIGSKGSGQMSDPDQYLGLLDDAVVEVDSGGGGGGTPPVLPETVAATVETVPASHSGDAADDPAIWPHPTDPSRSLVIGNDKGGALDVYGLDGQLVQRIQEGFFGNVDLRTGVTIGDRTRDLVAVWRSGLRLYTLDPDTRQLTNITDSTSGSLPVPTGGEGLCLYRDQAGTTSAIVIARNGTVAQYVLRDADGDSLVDASLGRSWAMGTESESCVADDDSGRLFISEEDVAIWRYDAAPTAPAGSSDRVAIDRVTSAGGRLLPDIEGLTIVDDGPGQGYLIASSQAGSDSANFYAVYDRAAPHTYVRSFAIGPGPATDNCGRTDGIAAYSGDLGPAFPQGMFVCQDNTNSTPGTSGNQNFKFVPLERVVPRGPQPLTAAFQLTGCEDLSCTFTATASRGNATFEWDFDDGTTDTGATVTHDFPAAGTYRVAVVARSDGEEARSERDVRVELAAADPIEFRGASAATANSTAVSPVIPTAVQAGDTLLLAVSANRANITATPPAGWTDLGTKIDESMLTRVWARTATAADAGATVRVTVATGTTKLTGQIVAYAGVDPSAPVYEVASANETGSGAAHTTPVATAFPGSWAVSIWANKSATTSGWTAPAAVVTRHQAITTGSGRVTSLIADSGGPVTGSSYGGLTAVATEGGTKATMWTIVLAPSAGT